MPFQGLVGRDVESKHLGLLQREPSHVLEEGSGEGDGVVGGVGNDIHVPLAEPVDYFPENCYHNCEDSY